MRHNVKFYAVRVLVAAAFFALQASAQSQIEISTPAQLKALGDGQLSLTGDYRLTADIDLDGIAFEPIGTFRDPFKGRFDGNGFVVKNLRISKRDENTGRVGLFGQIDAVGSVENLGVIGADVTGGFAVGALAGVNNGRITGCYSAGRVEAVRGQESNAGGLVGYNGGRIERSYSSATVTGVDNVGGLVGFLTVVNNQGVIRDCYAVGNARGNNNVGGLVGYVFGGTVERSYSMARLSKSTANAEGRHGGLIGTEFIDGRASNNIVGRNPSTGEFVKAAVINNCFWDIDVTGMTTSSGGGTQTGRTSVEMTDPETFTGWDIVTTEEYDPNAQSAQGGQWIISEGTGVPQLVIPDVIPIYTVTYTISPTAAAQGSITVNGNAVTSAGATVSTTVAAASAAAEVRAVPREGYEFVGWSVGGNIVSTDSVYMFVATGDATVEPVFRAKSVNTGGLSWEANTINWVNGYSTGLVRNASRWPDQITLNADNRLVVSGRTGSMDVWDIQLQQKPFNYRVRSDGSYVVRITGTVTGAPVEYNAGVQYDGAPHTTYVSTPAGGAPTIQIGSFTRDIVLWNTPNYATDGDNPNAVFYINFGFPGNGTITINSLTFIDGDPDEDGVLNNVNWTNPFSAAPVIASSAFDNITVNAQGGIVVTPASAAVNEWDVEIVQRNFNYIHTNSYVVTMSGTVTGAPVTFNILMQEYEGDWLTHTMSGEYTIPVGPFTREVTLLPGGTSDPAAQFAIKLGYPTNGTITLNSVVIAQAENSCANVASNWNNPYSTGDVSFQGQYVSSISCTPAGGIVVNSNPNATEFWHIVAVQSGFNYDMRDTYRVELNGTVTGNPMTVKITIRRNSSNGSVAYVFYDIYLPVGPFSQTVTLEQWNPNPSSGNTDPNAELTLQFGRNYDNASITINSVGVSTVGGGDGVLREADVIFVDPISKSFLDGMLPPSIGIGTTYSVTVATSAITAGGSPTFQGIPLSLSAEFPGSVRVVVGRDTTIFYSGGLATVETITDDGYTIFEVTLLDDVYGDVAEVGTVFDLVATVTSNAGARSDTASLRVGRSATSAQPPALSKLSVGPNPVSSEDGTIALYWEGDEIKSASLSVYSVSGSLVGRLSVDDPATGLAKRGLAVSADRRRVGEWSLRDRRSRRVSAGTYLVRGVVKTVDGRKEEVSVVVGVR